MGLATRSAESIFFIGVAYVIFCYFFGMFLFKIGFKEAQNEVMNQNDPFVKEMREKIKTKKFKYK